jgi:phosphoglycolate phosphatase-like HAD superfamily hydrolase
MYISSAMLPVMSKAAKVKTIAVAAGKFSADELSKYHPTYLFNDFSDTEVIIKTIEE